MPASTVALRLLLLLLLSTQPASAASNVSTAVAAQINARFTAGEAVSSITAAGVIIHQFDDLSEPATSAGTTSRRWMPCPRTCWGKPCWCAKFGDRFSCSLINAKSPPPNCTTAGACVPWTQARQIGIFASSAGVYNGGFVLAPPLLRLQCSYPGDGGTMTRLCLNENGTARFPGEPCVGGCECQDVGKAAEPFPCANSCAAPPPSPAAPNHQCAWPAANLSRMLEIQVRFGERVTIVRMYSYYTMVHAHVQLVIPIILIAQAYDVARCYGTPVVRVLNDGGQGQVTSTKLIRGRQRSHTNSLLK